jgi:conjugative transfer region protein TrbK
MSLRVWRCSMIEEQKQSHRRQTLVMPGWRAMAIGGIAAGLAIAALVALQDRAPPSARFVVTDQQDATTSAATDPLMAELLRCRSLPAGSDDAGCRAAWEVNRRRFMGESRSLTVPTGNPPSPASAGIPQGH